MQPITVFTVGYEDRNIREFISRLQRHNIQTVIDIRENPISRKSGFSKNQLSENLGSINIEYIHKKELGTPKTLRLKLQKDNDYETFFEEINKYLSTQIGVLRELYSNLISNRSCCIMCFERDPFRCHRQIVAKKIREIDGNGLIVTHI